MGKLLRILAVIIAVVVLAIVAVPAVDAAYTRDLTIGSSGSDVAELQAFLVSKGFLVMPAGVSTGYFGALTQAALARYQAANGIAPAAGYFGPLTRASVSAMGSSSSNQGSSSSSTQSTLGKGEASLESFDLDDEEDEIKEGSSEVVAVAQFDVEDGDVEIQRVDVTFEFDGQGKADSKPWKVFDEVILKANGKKIGSIDASNKKDWTSDKSPFVARFSGLKYVVKEGQTAEIEISVTAQNNVDGADDGDAEWIVYIDDNDIRAIDGEGIDQYIGKGSKTVAFEFVSESEGDDLELKDSDDEIKEDTIVLDEKKTTEAPIFAFVLSAEDSDNDIEINEIKVDVEISSTTAAIGDLVKDFRIEIDGESFDAESYNDDNDTVTLTFDIDGDSVVDADEEVEVVLYADFKKMDSDSLLQGTTIVASTSAALIDAEGADEVAVDGTPVVGEEQTLMTSGVVAKYVSESYSEEKPVDGKDGTIKIVFDLTGVGDDFEIADDGSDFTYTLTGATTTDAAVTVKSETAKSGNFTIKDGETDRVTFSVKFDTTTGFVQLEITDILGYTVRDIITDKN